MNERNKPNVFYREFPSQMFTEDEKKANSFAFLINSLMFK